MIYKFRIMKRQFLLLLFLIARVTQAQNPLVQFNDQLVSIVETATPSVVTIKTEKTLKVRQNDPFGDMFGGSFFNSWFGSPQEYDQNQKGMGSGVIISEEGYVVTNNHVIQGADKILVKIENGTEIEAKLIGADPRTDVAVLKITPYKGMKPLKIGNSDQLKVGELVLAIGSPLEDVIDQAQAASGFSQPQVSVVFAQHQPVFRPAGEHAVGFRHAAGNEVVHQNPYIGFVATRAPARLSTNLKRGVQSGQQSLRRRLLVAGGAVDLSGKE